MKVIRKFKVKRRFILIGTVIIVSSMMEVTSCKQPKYSCAIMLALKAANENKSELVKVINHYSRNRKDSMKLRAAIFMIENMIGLSSNVGQSLKIYSKYIYLAKKPVPTKQLDDLWNRAQKRAQNSIIRTELDIQTIKAKFLISNIDQAFSTWKSVPWGNKISFQIFCKYILPYRVLDETPLSGWRDTLRQKYAPLIANITNSQKAFVIIYNYLKRNTRSANSNCPFNLDVLTINNLGRGSCSQLCILSGAVLRALGIPVACDYVTNWANYSSTGHSWISYVENDSCTYTLFQNDSILRTDNPIDASTFEEASAPPKYPLALSFNKTVAKVYRNTFKRQHLDPDSRISMHSTDAHFKDISSQYNIGESLHLTTDSTIKMVSLSIFITGRDWKEILFSNSHDNVVTFSNIGSNIVYLPKYYDSTALLHVGPPFLFTKGNVTFLKPSKNLERAVLYRKYPLFARWTTLWIKMIGGRFEAANNDSFRDKTVLYTISSTFSGRTVVNVKNTEKFRFLRYVCPDKCRTPLAELKFYGETPKGIQLLNGEYIGQKVKKSEIPYTFDGNILTYPNTKQEEYWIGIHFNNAYRIKRIEYIPKNDGNFVQEGHSYELLYYDSTWRSLGIKMAVCDSLVYANTPDGALFLLKDRTMGSEERIFTYNANRQSWW